VQARVVVGPDLVGGRAHDDEVVVGDLVDVVVADLGDVVLTAHELPHLAPDLLDLGVVPRPRGVAVEGEVLDAEVVVAVVAQDVGHRTAVVVEVLLDAGAG
jgi:hypothetical protein